MINKIIFKTADLIKIINKTCIQIYFALYEITRFD